MRRAVEGDWKSSMWVQPDASATGFDETIDYALSIDGYAYARKMWGEDSDSPTLMARVDSFEDERGNWAGSFEDLRCCLFLLQRAIRWAEGSGPADDLRGRYARLYATLCAAGPQEPSRHRDR